MFACRRPIQLDSARPGTLKPARLLPGECPVGTLNLPENSAMCLTSHSAVTIGFMHNEGWAYCSSAWPESAEEERGLIDANRLRPYFLGLRARFLRGFFSCAGFGDSPMISASFGPSSTSMR